MKVTNNQQQTAFKANTIVRFANTTLPNMEELASVFTELKGHIASGQLGQARKIDENHVLVPDLSTTLGRIFEATLKFVNAAKNVLQGINNPKAKEALAHADDSILHMIEAIKEDPATLRAVSYKDFLD